MKTMETVEPGIYRRVDPRSGKVLSKLWIHSPGPGSVTIREPTHTTSLAKARRLRVKRLEQHSRGEPGRAAELIRVGALLDGYLTNRQVNGGDVSMAQTHLKALRPAVGHLKAVDCTTDIVEALQLEWQQAGFSNATINRRCNTLRRSFNLARRAGKVPVVPYIPRLDEPSRRAPYLSVMDAATLDDHLPQYLKLVFDFAYEHGTRKGQLTRTLRRFVELGRGVIVWPPDQCKHREPHTLPLEGASLELVASLMQKPPLWCPYLFHGPRCRPGHQPSKRYGCVGDFGKAWRTALLAARLPVGRKAGGIVFHCTRNAAATNLRAGGMDEADCMKITGHQTSHVFRHYDLGNVEALRQRLAAARTKVATLTPLQSVAR
jgi:integrase